MKYPLLKNCFIFLVTLLGFYNCYAQVPIINEITPGSTYSSNVINIKGENLANGDVVMFGGMKGSLISANDQLIEVEVPSGAIYDNVAVLDEATHITGYSTSPFLLSFGGNSAVSSGDYDVQTDFFSGDGLYDVCLCDLDGDLLNDFAAANTEDNAVIFLNTSTVGNLSTTKLETTLNATTLNVTCGDLNGDAKPEIVFTEGSNGNRIFIFVNNSIPGAFSFTIQTIAVNNFNTKKVVIGDADLDGFPDLMVTDQSNNQIAIYQNTTIGGSLSFENNPLILNVDNAESTASIQVNDLNGDRRPEIIVNQFLADGGGFFVATNNSSPGNIAYNNFEKYEVDGTLVNLKVADMNVDGRPDIVATKFLSNSIAIFINETSTTGGSPLFSSANNFTTDSNPWGLDIADMDGDGKPDLAVATIGDNKAVNILNNISSSGSLNFQKLSFGVTHINRYIKSGDIDGDGKPDLVFTSVDDNNQGIISSNVSILRNKKCIQPTINPAEPISFCDGASHQITTQLVESAIYEWRKDGVIVKSGAEHFLDVSVTGNYDVTLLMEASCSELSETISLEFLAAGALPSPAVNSNSPVCINGQLELDVEDVGGTMYVWRGPEGFSDNGASVSVSSFSFSNTGRYFVDIYSGDCVIETKSIVVDAIIAPEFLASQNGSGLYCEDELVQIDAFPSNPNYSYQWFDDDGSISGANALTFSPITTGNYYMSATDLINTSCPDVETNVVEVQFVDLPQAEFNLPDVSCVNSPVSFTNSSVVDAQAQADFNWDFGDENASNVENPTHVFVNPGTYDVTLNITYQGMSCIDQIAHSIIVNNNITVEILPVQASFCTGSSLELTTNGAFETYEWSTNESTPSIIVAEGGSYNVTVTDAFGCDGSGAIEVDEFSLPEVTVTANPLSVLSGVDVQLSVTGIVTYEWSPVELLDDPNIANPIAQPDRTTLFTVSGIDANDCPGSASVEVTVLLEDAKDVLKPHNFFSPNTADNINQFWVVERIEDFPDCGVEIYDQTGNLILNAKPYLNDWEGTFKGRSLNSGVYYYIIRCNNNEAAISGSITLLTN